MVSFVLFACLLSVLPRVSLSMPDALSASRSLLDGWPVYLSRSPLAGHGLFASRDINSGENMLCTPFERTLGRNFIYDAGLAELRNLIGKGELAPIDIMALAVARVMYDEGADPWLDEKWGPIAATWPKNLSYCGGTMYTHSPDPDASLSDLPRHPVFMRERGTDRWYHTKVVPVLERYPDYFGSPVREAYDLEHYTHARQTVSSRGYGEGSFGWGRAPEESNYGLLIPGLDLFNHPPSRSMYNDTSIHPTREHGPCIFAHRDFKRGEEIYSSYGLRDSFLRAFAYGFLGDVDTRLDYVTVRIDVRSLGGYAPDPFYRLSVGELFEDNSTVYSVVKADSIAHLLPYTRMVALINSHGAETAIKHADRCFCTGEINFSTCGVSKENEVAARKLLRTTLSSMRSEIRHGSVAALDAYVSAHGHAMSQRAKLVTGLRRAALSVLEKAEAFADEVHRGAHAEYFNSVVLTPPMM